MLCLSQGENFLQNSGFESGKDNWIEFIPPEHGGASLSWDVSNKEPHSGTASLAMNSTEPARWCVANKKGFPVEAGQKYRVRAWVRFDQDATLETQAPAAYIRCTVSEAAGLDLADPLGHLHVGLNGKVARNPSVAKLNVPALPTGWRKIEAVVTIPPDATVMGLGLFVQGVTGIIFWDDISLEPASADTAASETVEN